MTHDEATSLATIIATSTVLNVSPIAIDMGDTHIIRLDDNENDAELCNTWYITSPKDWAILAMRQQQKAK